MEMEQVREWAEAQKITFSVDLIESAKKLMKFLAVVDRNRYLYEDDTLQRAIYRYNACWLPLLAKHLENPVSEKEALVVPLDCEWIWNCHRLNPLRYKWDCEKLFGRILGTQNVVSSVEGTSKSASEEIWNKMYPQEPYELGMTKPFDLEDVLQKSSGIEKFTSYDLVSAVKRQISFTHQITRPFISDELYLQEAVARYKGFLHMVRTTEEKKLKCYCVPTYDIDLMWHAHQLHPDAYCKDLTNSVGKVVHHNDKVSDRSVGHIREIGFYELTTLWGQTFGKSYWNAGTLRKEKAPSPVTEVPIKFMNNIEGKELNALDNGGNLIQFPSMEVVEVLLDFVEIKNLSEEHKGNLIVYYSKKQADKFLNTKRSQSISSNSDEIKQVAPFQCEPTGEFLFELVSISPVSNDQTPQKSLKKLGCCTLSLEELTSSKSQLSASKWLAFEPASSNISSRPILLHTFISFTPSTPAPQVFQISRSIHTPKTENGNICTRVLDQDGNDVFSLYMRNTAKDTTKEVHCITNCGEKHRLAEFVGNHWSIKGSNGLLKLQNKSETDDSLFELVGYKMVKFFAGRRLDFETKRLEKQTRKQGFVTAVEFSADYPYGKAVALIDFMTETITATEEWIILPGITMAFLLSAFPKEEIDSKTGNNATQAITKIGDNGVLKSEMGAECFLCNDCGTVIDPDVKYGDVIQVTAKSGENGAIKSEMGAECFLCNDCGTVIDPDVKVGDVIQATAKTGENGVIKSEMGAECFLCNDCGTVIDPDVKVGDVLQVTAETGENGVMKSEMGAECFLSNDCGTVIDPDVKYGDVIQATAETGENGVMKSEMGAECFLCNDCGTVIDPDVKYGGVPNFTDCGPDPGNAHFVLSPVSSAVAY